MLGTFSARSALAAFAASLPCYLVNAQRHVLNRASTIMLALLHLVMSSRQKLRYWLSAFVHLGYHSHRHHFATAPLGINPPKGLRLAGGYSLRACHVPCYLRD